MGRFRLGGVACALAAGTFYSAFVFASSIPIGRVSGSVDVTDGSSDSAYVGRSRIGDEPLAVSGSTSDDGGRGNFAARAEVDGGKISLGASANARANYSGAGKVGDDHAVASGAATWSADVVFKPSKSSSKSPATADFKFGLHGVVDGSGATFALLNNGVGVHGVGGSTLLAVDPGVKSNVAFVAAAGGAYLVDGDVDFTIPLHKSAAGDYIGRLSLSLQTGASAREGAGAFADFLHTAVLNGISLPDLNNAAPAAGGFTTSFAPAQITIIPTGSSDVGSVPEPTSLLVWSALGVGLGLRGLRPMRRAAALG